MANCAKKLFNMDVSRIKKFSVLSLFYDVESYRIAFGWGAAKCAGVFVLCCALFALAACLVVYAPVKKGFDENIGAVRSALKEVKIEKGKVVPIAGTDIEIKSPDGAVFAVVSKSPIDANKTRDLLFSIEGTRLSLYRDGSEMPFDLNSFEYGDARDLAQILPDWATVAFFVMPFVAFVSAVSVQMWHVFMLGAFAFIMDIPRGKFGMAKCLKLSLAVSVPAVCVNLAVVLGFGVMLPDVAVVAVSAVLLYFVYAALARARNQK